MSKLDRLKAGIVLLVPYLVLIALVLAVVLIASNLLFPASDTIIIEMASAL